MQAHLLIKLSCALALASFVAPSSADRVSPIIQPGYVPGSEAKMDERGIWMEMAEAELDLNHSPLVLRDTTLDAFVRDIACEVARDYCTDVRVYVLRNPHFNASMAPNGTMLVHTGLITRAVSADQVAAVIGHELAHYTQTHSIKRLRAQKSRMTVGMLLSMGLAVGGVNSGGLPEILALTSVMGFTREQESEADEVGAHFMQQAGYDPYAAASLWQMLEEEENAASIKSPEGPVFLSSHPPPETRAAKLASLAGTLEPSAGTLHAHDALVDVLTEHYAMLMDDQVKQRDHGRLNALLQRHEALGVNPADIAFYRGEAWRLRGGAGDHEKAMAEYLSATHGDQPNARAFKELGYLLYKHGDPAEASRMFEKFLTLVPDAPDREMIEFYLEGGW